MFTLNLNKINRFRLTAILLLIGGFSTLLYTVSSIQGYNQVLGSSQLTAEEMWSYEGALQWWQSAYTAILPLTAIMITAGLVTLMGPTILTRIQQRYAIKTFTNELELASTEKFEIK